MGEGGGGGGGGQYELMSEDVQCGQGLLHTSLPNEAGNNPGIPRVTIGISSSVKSQRHLVEAVTCCMGHRAYRYLCAS